MISGIEAVIQRTSARHYMVLNSNAFRFFLRVYDTLFSYRARRSKHQLSPLFLATPRDRNPSDSTCKRLCSSALGSGIWNVRLHIIQDDDVSAKSVWACDQLRECTPIFDVRAQFNTCRTFEAQRKAQNGIWGHPFARTGRSLLKFPP